MRVTQARSQPLPHLLSRAEHGMEEDQGFRGLRMAQMYPVRMSEIFGGRLAE